MVEPTMNLYAGALLDQTDQLAALRAGFWLRRMTHETAVHRADVALTVDEQFRLDANLPPTPSPSG